MKINELKIKINGKEFSELELLSLDIWYAHQKLSKAKLKFLDGQNLLNWNTYLGVSNAEVEVLGQDQNQQEITLFKGFILHTKTNLLNNRKYYVIKAKSLLHKATINKKSKIYKNQNEKEVFNDVLTPYNAQLEMFGNPAGKDDLIQFQTSDWDFLNLRAEVNALFLYEKNGAVTLHPLNENELSPIRIDKNEIMQCEIECNGVNAFEGVSRSFWDLEADQVDETVAETDGNHGLYQNQKNSSSDPNAHQKEVFNWSDHKDPNWTVNKLKWNEFSVLNGLICVKGKVDFQPGQLIDLSEINPQMQAKAIIGGVHNQWEQQHFYSYLSLGLHQNFHQPVLESPNYSNNNPILIGKVQSYEEDDSGHFKVALTLNHPEFQNQWVAARVLQSANGIHVFPDLGAWVVVGFIYGDFKDPVVLGTFYDKNNHPPFDLNNTNAFKGLLSPYGFEFSVDDASKSIKLSSPEGLEVIYKEEEKTFSFKDPHGNEVLFDEQGIHIKSVDQMSLESKGNMDLKSGKDIGIESKMKWKTSAQDAELKCKGKVQMEGLQLALKGQTLCEINGSMVKIN